MPWCYCCVTVGCYCSVPVWQHLWNTVQSPSSSWVVTASWIIIKTKDRLFQSRCSKAQKRWAVMDLDSGAKVLWLSAPSVSLDLTQVINVAPKREQKNKRTLADAPKRSSFPPRRRRWVMTEDSGKAIVSNVLSQHYPQEYHTYWRININKCCFSKASFWLFE